MNKRSAMMAAAGLVLAMLVAGMAVAAGFTGPEAAASGSKVTTGDLQRPEPKVRTITETVTVHRDAKPSDETTPPPVVITQAPSAPTSATTTSDDAYEDDHEGADDHEGEDD